MGVVWREFVCMGRLSMAMARQRDSLKYRRKREREPNSRFKVRPIIKSFRESVIFGRESLASSPNCQSISLLSSFVETKPLQLFFQLFN